MSVKTVVGLGWARLSCRMYSPFSVATALTSPFFEHVPVACTLHETRNGSTSNASNQMIQSVLLRGITSVWGALFC